MNKFIHGGRLGDCVYSLYAVKMLGGGIYQICLYHGKAWNEKMLRSILPLIRAQTYITDARFTSVPQNWWTDDNKHCRHIFDHAFAPADYDLIRADSMRNPEDFPELIPGTWPGNVHLAKRYAQPFGIKWYPETKWLDVDCNYAGAVDIVFHAPTRRIVRQKNEWISILSVLASKRDLIIVGGENDIHEWYVEGAELIVPIDMLQTARIVSSAKLFIGAASSVNTIAEGLKKTRLVELAPDCFNTYPYGESGMCINGLNAAEVMGLAEELSR